MTNSIDPESAPVGSSAQRAAPWLRRPLRILAEIISVPALFFFPFLVITAFQGGSAVVLEQTLAIFEVYILRLWFGFPVFTVVYILVRASLIRRLAKDSWLRFCLAVWTMSFAWHFWAWLLGQFVEAEAAPLFGSLLLGLINGLLFEVLLIWVDSLLRWYAGPRFRESQ